MNKQILTITGIRPDFIRMSKIFKKLDENFDHILIHTGQHYDKMLSDVFFDELEIRKPDYNLEIGGIGKKHYHQVGELSVKIIDLIVKEELNPDIILFLGDSNSVACSLSLKKEGYKIGHIEAGMRSYDKRMLEEINRVVCDHCSDYLFVYHEDYKRQAEDENILKENIIVVGNTIVEVVDVFKKDIISEKKTFDSILMDIHRPENFQDIERLKNIFKYANFLKRFFNVPVNMLSFSRTIKVIEDNSINIGEVKIVPLMSYKEFLLAQYNAVCIISDSGTAQEEAAMLNTPVIVPRDFTERPQSIVNNCSLMVDVNEIDLKSVKKTLEWITERNLNKDMKTKWLGEGKTSDLIVNFIKENL